MSLVFFGVMAVEYMRRLGSWYNRGHCCTMIKFSCVTVIPLSPGTFCSFPVFFFNMVNVVYVGGCVACVPSFSPRCVLYVTILPRF